MPTVDSIEAAMAYIENAIQMTLGNEVLWAVQTEETKQVEEVVYDAYEPRMYERRWDMSNIKNMPGEVVGTTLVVRNTTPPNTLIYEPDKDWWSVAEVTGKDLAMVVETGEGYDFYSPGARPFTQATIDALAASKEHVTALKRGLRAAGLRVK